MSLKYKLKKDLLTLGLVTTMSATALSGCSKNCDSDNGVYSYMQQLNNDEYQLNNLAMLEYKDENGVKRIFVSYYFEENGNIILNGISDNKIKVRGIRNEYEEYEYNFIMPDEEISQIKLDYNIGKYITKTTKDTTITYDEVIEYEKQLLYSDKFDDKVVNNNFESLQENVKLTEEMEEEILRAYSLTKNDYSKGGDFIIALAILDCQMYGKNKKYVIRTIKRNEEFEVLIGINNPEILVFGININGEYEYTSLASDHLIINSIDTDVEKYFPYIERIPNEEPTVSYEEIKALEDDLNNSNKLTRKY